MADDVVLPLRSPKPMMRPPVVLVVLIQTSRLNRLGAESELPFWVIHSLESRIALFASLRAPAWLKVVEFMIAPSRWLPEESATENPLFSSSRQ